MKSSNQIAIFTRIAAITGIGISTKYENQSHEIMHTESQAMTALIQDVAQDLILSAVLMSTAVVGSHQANPQIIFAAATHKTSFC